MSKFSLVHTSKINGIRFSLSGSDEAEADSYTTITTWDLFNNNLPYSSGVYDAHLGTTDHSYKCQTCLNTKRFCPGHEGKIELNYPVINPLALNEIKKWLKIICFNCGKPIMKESVYIHIKPANTRIALLTKTVKSDNSQRCVHCDTLHPIVKKRQFEPLLLSAEIIEDKKQIDKFNIFPHMIENIFSKITNETVLNLGKKIESHPKNYVLRTIKVPSVIIRPDVRKIGGGRSTNDSLTNMLQQIVKLNESLPKLIPETIDIKLEKNLMGVVNAYYDLIKSKNETNKSLTKRLTKKEGLIRKNILGKRTFNMCRSTIVGDPTLHPTQVGVPLVFAKTIQMKETVQEYNKHIIAKYIQNGKTKYPGASKIIKHKTKVEYDISTVKNINIENGDIILRDMVDNDCVLFNRQPSLLASNIYMQYAKIKRDPNDRTLSMNVVTTPLSNADFDGDQMHLIINTNMAARNEIEYLSGVDNWLISYTDSTPVLGQVDDSKIGLSELTRSKTKFDKYHAMLIFQNSKFIPDFAEESYSGKDLISLLLQEAPINYENKPTWYNKNMSPYIKYDETEIKTVIKDGKMLSGVLDKKSIGAGVSGSIYHVIANEFGHNKSIDVLYNMQQMAIAYIYQFGYTIGIGDLIIDKKTKKEVDRIAADIINKSKIIIDRYNNGNIVPPIGKTINEFMEEQQINTLSIFDDFAEPILSSINPETNNLFKLISFGSKGKIANMYNMVSAVGQKLINGERARETFGFRRTLPYFPRFDMNPSALGYITNSYLGGITSIEYIFNAMASRFDLISKALSTSVTGEQNRKSIKNLESIIANYFRWSVKNRNVIQYAYGENCTDPRYVEKVKFPTVMCSDKEFKDRYYHKDFPKFFELMKSDRIKFRKYFFKLENSNVKEILDDSKFLPMNIPRIIKKYSSTSNDKKDLSLMVKMLNEFCDTLPYILMNEIQEIAKAKIPNHLLAASWLVCMSVRSYLHPNALIKYNITPTILQLICDDIRIKYGHSLIDPGSAVGVIAAQSFSEPLTQYMLDAHHRSASGGTSKSMMTTFKEILGARTTEKLTAPSMLIPVKKDIMHDKSKVRKIANNIEMMRFKQFVSLWQIFFEKFAEPVHSKYKHEKELIKYFLKRNPLLKPPGDLISWCIRVEVDKTSLIMKNMTLELIISRLREIHPETFIVYTPENAQKIIIRIYPRMSIFRNAINIDIMKEYGEKLMATLIRGVEGITSALVTKFIRNKINEDNSIEQDQEAYCIQTVGTNMRGVMSVKDVDPLNILTDDIQGTASILGIEAARQRVVAGLRDLVDCGYSHLSIYADEMTFTGKVTSIGPGGLKTREPSNILLRVGFSSPIQSLEEASINASHDEVKGLTSSLLVGTTPNYGTNYSQFYADSEFIKKNMPSTSDILDTLYE